MTYGSTPMSVIRVSADGASLVWIDDKHQMAGQRGADGDLGGLGVAHLAHHDHVGVEAQDRAQPCGEGQVRRAG